MVMPWSFCKNRFIITVAVLQACMTNSPTNTQTDSFMGACSPVRAYVKAAGLLTVAMATLTPPPDSRLHVRLKRKQSAAPHTLT